MLIEFSVSNFRSIKEEQFLTMVADSGKSKLKNTFTPRNNPKLRLLKSAVIYGANASGKTNVIRAFRALHFFILNSSKLDTGEDIPCYEPFAFDASYVNAPSEFKIIFLGTDNIKYDYQVKFDRKQILFEQLDFYPKGRKANLFVRTANHEVRKGRFFKDKREAPGRVLENCLYLSAVGHSPHKQINEIYRYFKDRVEIWNQAHKQRDALIKHTSEILFEKDRAGLKRKLGKLVKVADTMIENISIDEKSEEDFHFPDDLPRELKHEIIRQNRYKIYAVHEIYEDGERTGTKDFDMKEESEGTNALYALGGLILEKFESGGVIFFGELENSLHPKLCRFLINLFHHPRSNPENAQLVFASHETTLLDRDLFRKDQIWFTEKNKCAATELFSVSDFDDVPDNVPFDQWYMRGKFGGQPNIREIEFIFDNE
ncbi:ATP-binding protein [Desulfobacterales bacterium HSG2]|nr:ATP-binding protein [Desulfobacterales bacterium HSG2]